MTNSRTNDFYLRRNANIQIETADGKLSFRILNILHFSICILHFAFCYLRESSLATPIQFTSILNP